MKIRNRSASVVGYKIPDLNIRRRFVPGEVKEIPKEELEKLLYQTGGRELLENYLQVAVEDVKKLNMDTPEQEYFYTDNEIKDLILTGSLDEFLDMLDFAPEGVINLVKDYAIKLPMADRNKMNALKEKTGFDVNKALENTADITEVMETAPKRRVNKESKYKVITDN